MMPANNNRTMNLYSTTNKKKYLTHTQIQVAGNCLFNKCKVIVNSNHQEVVFMQLLFALQSSSQSVASIIGVHMKEVQVKDTSNSSINTCGKRITPMCGFYLSNVLWNNNTSLYSQLLFTGVQ